MEIKQLIKPQLSCGVVSPTFCEAMIAFDLGYAVKSNLEGYQSLGTLALLGAGLMYIIKRVGSAMRGSHNETFSAWLTWQELNNAEKIYAAKLYLNNQCGHVTSKFMQIFQPGKVKKLAGVKEK